MTRRRQIRSERLPVAGTFRIARGARTHVDVVVVELTEGSLTGRGEAVPYARYGESVESVVAAIEAIPVDVDRDSLQSALPAGAARNALDCALWDLSARRTGRRVWELAGLPAPVPVRTAFTVSVDGPEAMGAAAGQAVGAGHGLLKLKLDGSALDLRRVRAVREAAPEAALIVDANESFTPEHLLALGPELLALGACLIEQPLPADADACLAELPRPVPLCADESCHTVEDLPRLAGRYDLVNVKLDKAGGLTGALQLARAAREQGLGVMVGCMVSSSLAVAPAVLLASFAEHVDLDGPLLLAGDRSPGLRYEVDLVYPPDPALWG